MKVKLVDFFLVLIDPFPGFFFGHGIGLLVFLFHLSAPFRPGSPMVLGASGSGRTSELFFCPKFTQKILIAYTPEAMFIILRKTFVKLISIRADTAQARRLS